MSASNLTDRPPDRATRKVALAALVGSALEWYDFYLYGTASALVFNRIIFPTFDPTVATLASFGTLAVGYFIRPLGGLVFGRLGDLVGRRNVLVITLLVMGVSTVLMACVPTYKQVGVLAPILLVVLRAVQGIGAGAEFGGAAILSAEHAPPRRRGLYGAFPAVGVYLGLLLASGAFAIVTQLPEEQFLSWGWRIPFAASVVVIAVALVIRLRLTESPMFLAAQQQEPETPVSPIREVFQNEKRAGLVLIGTQTPQNVVAYLNLTFMAAYLTGTLKLSISIGPIAITVATLVTMITLPLFGALSDRVGRRPVVLFGIGFSALFVYPYFWVIDGTRAPVPITLMIVASLGIGVGAMFGPQGAYFSELFTARSRFTGLAFSREVAGALSGGLTPIIAVALVVAASGRSWLVALFVVIACVIGAVATVLGPETRGRSLTATTVGELRASTGRFSD